MRWALIWFLQQPPRVYGLALNFSEPGFPEKIGWSNTDHKTVSIYFMSFPDKMVIYRYLWQKTEFNSLSHPQLKYFCFCPWLHLNFISFNSIYSSEIMSYSLSPWRLSQSYQVRALSSSFECPWHHQVWLSVTVSLVLVLTLHHSPMPFIELLLCYV